MSQFFPFSLFTPVEGSSRAKNVLTLGGSRNTTKDGLSFETILANALGKSNVSAMSGDTELKLSAATGLGFAPTTMEAIPFSLLYPEINNTKDVETELTLPPEALKQDAQGRLLVSLRHLSAMVEKLNQSAGETGNEKSVDQLVAEGGDGDSLDHAVLALDAKIQLTGAETAVDNNTVSEAAKAIEVKASDILQQNLRKGLRYYHKIANSSGFLILHICFLSFLLVQQLS